MVDRQEATTVMWYKYASPIITAIGSTSGLIEHSGINATARFRKSVKSPVKIYKSGWHGGTRARIKTYKVTYLAKNAGEKIFFVGALVEGFGAFTGQVSPLKAGMNVAISAIATWGGPIGLTIGLVYFGLDLLGAFDTPNYIQNNSYQQYPLKQPVDNLRVVIPVRPMPQQIIKRRYESKQTFIGPAPAKRY